jgi:hypothetical protein
MCFHQILVAAPTYYDGPGLKVKYFNALESNLAKSEPLTNVGIGGCVSGI